MMFSFGHPRGQGKQFDLANLLAGYTEFFDKHLKHSSRKPGNVDGDQADLPEQRLVGRDDHRLRPGSSCTPTEVRYQDAAAQTILSSGDALGPQLDPIAGTGACGTTTSADQASSATYRLPTRTGSGYTMIGSPTIIADINVSGANPEDSEIAGRLFDVDSGGTQTLVSKGVYRPDANGQVVFQLGAERAGKFRPVTYAKLELPGIGLARLAGLERRVLDRRLEPRPEAADAETSGGQVLTPAAPVLPPGAVPVP